MIKKDDLKLFWSFLYGIENLPIPNDETKHFGIAGDILGVITSAAFLWKINQFEVEDPLNLNKKLKGFIKLTVGNDVLAKEVRLGNISISVRFHKVVVYFRQLI